MENIEYLYHYTSLENLALILKNRTIRFNSLDKMDDLQEKETADLKNIGQFFYISSWTEDATESIPMWNMYASLTSGIRIKLRKNPFKIYENTAVDLSHVIHASVTDNTDGKPLLSIIPLTEMFEKGFIAPQALARDLLRKVEYTDDQEKLYPRMLTENGNQFTIAMGEMGRYKNLHWSFQCEWRYILNILPVDLNQPVEASMNEFQLMANKMRWGIAKQPFPFYDMVIADEAFADMEITLSPRISAGNRIIVQSLIEKHNSSAMLCESSLLGLI